MPLNGASEAPLRPLLDRTTLGDELKDPVMRNDRSDQMPTTVQSARNGPDSTPTTSARAEIDSFLDRVNALGPGTKTGLRGRLIFALDATLSRQPTWDQACKLQAEMFRAAAAVGGL